MARIKLIIIVLVVAGAASLLIWQCSTNAQLRRDNESLRGAIAELKQAQEVHETTPDDSATKEQLAELLKLRSEVTQLRGQTNQIAALAEANKKLQVSLENTKSQSTKQTAKKDPPEALSQDIHPRATWAFRGYGTPDATMESILSAMLNGDKAASLAGFAPEMRAQIEGQFNNVVERVKADEGAEFRILNRQALKDDEMVVSIYMTSKNANGELEGHSEKTVFDKIDGQWLVTQKPAPSDQQ